MDIVLVNPIAATPDITWTSLARPRVSRIAPEAVLQINIVELAAAFAELGHTVTVVLGAPYLDGEPVVLADRIRVLPVNTYLTVPFHPGLVPLTPALMRHPFLQEADVIQSAEFHQPATFFASVAARERDVPLVVWQETFAPMRPPGSWYQLMYEATAGRCVRAIARRFVPRTTRAREYLVSLRIPEEGIGPWIPTGIDRTVYAPRTTQGPETFGLPTDAKVLLLVTRLHPNKGGDFALSVVRRVAQEEPRVHLVIRGAGPELSTLETLARKLGVADRIRILSRLSRDRLVDLYNMAEVVLCTSTIDLMPFNLIEASACGRPCVATDVGAVADIVADGETGWVVRERTVEAFSNAVLSLLGDDAMRSSFGRRARLRSELFGLPHVANELLEVYRHAAT